MAVRFFALFFFFYCLIPCVLTRKALTPIISPEYPLPAGWGGGVGAIPRALRPASPPWHRDAAWAGGNVTADS